MENLIDQQKVLMEGSDAYKEDQDAEEDDAVDCVMDYFYNEIVIPPEEVAATSNKP